MDLRTAPFTFSASLVRLGLVDTCLYKRLRSRDCTDARRSEAVRSEEGYDRREGDIEGTDCALSSGPAPRAEQPMTLNGKDMAVCSVALTMLRIQLYREMIRAVPGSGPEGDKCRNGEQTEAWMLSELTVQSSQEEQAGCRFDLRERSRDQG